MFTLFPEIWSPIDQFDIYYLVYLKIKILVGSLYLSLTNIGFYLIIGGLIVLILNLIATNYNKLISDKWSIIKEALYTTIQNIIINTGRYFPLLYTLFVIVLINNLIGMVSYSFSSTGHFALTFALSTTIVLGATILGLFLHGIDFFSLFIPKGSPLPLLLLIILIELISYLARCISLGLRLGANIVAGHMLLSILCGFIYKIFTTAKVLPLGLAGLIPLGFIIAFAGLELAIAVIQSQVFVVLSSGYIKDGQNLH